MIPELEKIYKAIGEILVTAEEKAERVRALEARGEDSPELAIERSQLQFLSNGINEWLKRILDIGAMPKGLSPALVDFPHQLEGREVCLCWKLGEKKITHYHGLDEGYAGRRPLPGRHRPS